MDDTPNSTPHRQNLSIPDPTPDIITIDSTPGSDTAGSSSTPVVGAEAGHSFEAPCQTPLVHLFDDIDEISPTDCSLTLLNLLDNHSDDEDEIDKELQDLNTSRPVPKRLGGTMHNHSVNEAVSISNHIPQATGRVTSRETQNSSCSCPSPSQPYPINVNNADSPTSQFDTLLGCNPRSGLCVNGDPARCPFCLNSYSGFRPPFCDSLNCRNRNANLLQPQSSQREASTTSAAQVFGVCDDDVPGRAIEGDGTSDEDYVNEVDNNNEGFTAGLNGAAKPDLATTPQFHSDLLTLNENCSDATREMDTPEELNITLLKHQRQALCWMFERERSDNKPLGHPRGGILADDQGFGKTLSLISLMLTNRPPQRPNSSNRVAWGNLVVAPTSILQQWVGELRDRIDALYRPKILIYHGSKRVRDPYELVKYDVVITSYGVLVQEYPKEEKIWDARTQKLVKKIRPKGPLYRVGWYRVILDEAQSIKNRQSDTHKASRALHSQCRWAVTGTPIQNSIDDIYAKFLFLGYEVVSSHKEWNSRYKKMLEGSVSQMRRERAFKQFQLLLGPILLRRAKHDKIDGKPIIPLPARTVRVLELKFSRTEAEYYHAQEVQAVRDMNRLMNDTIERNVLTSALVILLRLRQACNHPKLCEWNMSGIFKFSEDELDVMDMRMRTKSLFRSLDSNVQDRLYRELEPGSSTAHTCPVCMDILTSDGIVTRCGHFFCKSDFDEWAKSHDTCPTCRTTLSEGESMPIDLVRMEVHALARRKQREAEQKSKPPSDIKLEKRENSIAARLFSKREDSSDDEATSLEAPVKKQRAENGNAVVATAMKNVKDEVEEVKQEQELVLKTPTRGVRDRRGRGRGRRGAPSRRARAPAPQSQEQDEIEEVEAGPSPVSQPATSIKIRTFISEYRKIVETTDDKVLCFSQWTRMLDLVEERLVVEGFEFARLDGTQTIEERAEAVKMFQSRSKCRVFLISLQAGSTGLNLTVANRVFLLDSWWNPAVEDQAIDRVHRIGQKKDVEIIKMKIVNSVEERILALQDKKREVADGVLGKEGLQTIGRRQLSMREVLDLFTDVYENVAQRAEENNDVATMNLAQSNMNMSRSL